MTNQAAKQAARMRLKSALATFAGADITKWSDDPNDTITDPFGLGMTEYGVENITDFLNLSFEDIEMMDHVNKAQKNKLKIMISIFHHLSNLVGEPISFEDITVEEFDEYRITEYVPGAPLVPWSKSRKEKLVPKPEEKKGLTSEEQEVQTWQRNIKPNAAAYKELKDAAYFALWKEKFETTAEAQGLGHMLDFGYEPKNKALDQFQSKWLYKVLQDTCIERTARSIVMDYKHRRTEFRSLWNELINKFSKAIETDMKIQNLTSYIVGVRFTNSNWRGTQASMLHHYKEQVRLYEEIAPKSEHYIDVQLNRFLSNAVIGIENLRQVKSLYEDQQRAAGKPIDLTFSKYVELLLVQAKIYDNARGLSGSTKNRRVNVHDFDGDYEYVDEYEEWTPETDVEEVMEVMMHGTNFGSASRNDSSKALHKPAGPRKVFMNFNTWKSLSQSDQKAWDSLSEDGKKKLSEYWIARGKMLAKDPQKYNNDARAANLHETDDTENLVFEEDSEVSANIHDTVKTNETDEKTVKMANTGKKTKKLEKSREGNKGPKPISINMSRIMSTDPKTKMKVDEALQGYQVNMAERSDFTPVDIREVHMMRSSYESDGGNSEETNQPSGNYAERFLARRNARLAREKKEREQMNSPSNEESFQTPEVKPQASMPPTDKTASVTQRIAERLAEKTRIRTPIPDDVDIINVDSSDKDDVDDSKPPPLEDLKTVVKEDSHEDTPFRTPENLEVKMYVPRASPDIMSDEKWKNATQEEIDTLVKFGVIEPVYENNGTVWSTPPKVSSGFKFSPSILDRQTPTKLSPKKELLKELPTKLAAASSAPTDTVTTSGSITTPAKSKDPSDSSSDKR